jgi:hypothetical protein
MRLEIPWGNIIFNESATKYNNDIAIISLVLANNAYSENTLKRTLNTLNFSDDYYVSNYDYE